MQGVSTYCIHTSNPTYVINASGFNNKKIHYKLVRDSFLCILILLFFLIMINTPTEQKIDGKNIILKYEQMREQNAFHVTHIPPCSSSLLQLKIFQKVRVFLQYIYKMMNREKCFHSSYMKGFLLVIYMKYNKIIQKKNIFEWKKVKVTKIYTYIFCFIHI